MEPLSIGPVLEVTSVFPGGGGWSGGGSSYIIRNTLNPMQTDASTLTLGIVQVIFTGTMSCSLQYSVSNKDLHTRHDYSARTLLRIISSKNKDSHFYLMPPVPSNLYMRPFHSNPSLTVS